ncbi:dienelactone hydrolase [Methanohalobium evestigatum Z-7303]|uniref:Dienelactone hydrolase n=1 Tax=Methanohalobium evestigatum (strain ATCC BAA-1072 / DSM 3721 / NBRC 107634 / OCM 161 / Z-7303) TaxID=644295 RepID=D7E9Z8_METEZ|nr:alpha/beta fold hydrolase [Methanohalobium evestigatum]ADI74420.1 dienelactone hydrolase [Methanohalobium evestigatum Z-7303]
MNTGSEDKTVQISVDSEQIEGDLTIPNNPDGIIIFAHGSGSSRHSPRNKYVAQNLQDNGFATLLIDLLTPDEDETDRLTGRLRFDIDLLSRRLVTATNWVLNNPETSNLNIGYFGASTGAAAALIAAAQHPMYINAVVSRGGRPDLAEHIFDRVQAPTLLIVGGNDPKVIELNKWAMERMNAKKKLEIVPGATHLFEEPGKLEEVSRLAGEWFKQYLK